VLARQRGREFKHVRLTVKHYLLALVTCLAAAPARHHAQRDRGRGACGMPSDTHGVYFLTSCRILKLSTPCVASESHDEVCVRDSSRKRQNVDIQLVLMRDIVRGHFTIRARVRA
jgi:hypothetical protein